MIRLYRLHFVLYLPVETKLEKLDLDWSKLDHQAVEYEINDVMFLYTVPSILNSQRRVCNETFVQQSTINNDITHIEWVINRDLLSLDTTLVHFQHVQSLQLVFDVTVSIEYELLHIFICINSLGNEIRSTFLACDNAMFAFSSTSYSAKLSVIEGTIRWI